MRKDPQTLSRPELERAMDKAARAASALCDEMIAAGRGHETCSETARKDDPLSARFNAAWAAERELRDEASRRMEYHGNLLPIKRQA